VLLQSEVIEMEQIKKKEMLKQYKERYIIGGVYAIKNTLKNRLFLGDSTDIQGSKNRFEMSVKTGSCVNMKLQSEWKEQEGEHFVFEILEELKKGDAQSFVDFRADIGLLKQIWIEKLSGDGQYEILS
jgi:hypothetical protein